MTLDDVTVKVQAAYVNAEKGEYFTAASKLKAAADMMLQVAEQDLIEVSK